MWVGGSIKIIENEIQISFVVFFCKNDFIFNSEDCIEQQFEIVFQFNMY